MPRCMGTVRWFNPVKGFGFLGRNGGADVFVHYTAIQNGDFRSMKEGEPVSFVITEGGQGPQAAQVHRLDGTERAGMDVGGSVRRPLA